jgi:2-dehydro-3-deoxygalactonokinase
MSEDEPLVCVDGGTSHTRLWLVRGTEVWARRAMAVGARDTARDGHNGRLKAGLREAVEELLKERPSGVPAPRLIAAAGMITSAQGLLDVPHVPAPAGPADIAAAAQERPFADVSDLPFVFMPGVRTFERPGAAKGVVAADVMRGEETLCLGLLRLGLLAPGTALLNLGSHWKLVRTDADGRVAWSVTSLSGEMIQALRDGTVLTSALPDGPLREVDRGALAGGMEEARRSGLPRALFAIRLFELSGRTTPAARLSFLAGAFIGAELDGLRATGALAPGTSVTISGGEKVGGAWGLALEQSGHRVRSLSPAEVEAGFLAGLRHVVSLRAR